MSEAKPTPGNWVAVPSAAWPDCGATFIEADGKVIGGACAHPVDFSVAEREANARIFAAGKDMLAALEAVVCVADRKTDEFDMAFAAIAKATGEAK